jgi:pyruvate/2-oxoglutarate dehydrogenase complex dihydrolipoamide dehydrogenase (E3) component
MNINSHTWNLVVLGGGTAGIVAAKTAVGLGSEVLLIERERTGGDCLWAGCIPSKALIAASRVASNTLNGAEFGVIAKDVKVDFPSVMRHVQSAIHRIEPHDSPDGLMDFGITFLRGNAHFLDSRTIEVDRSEIRFRTAIIATGATPAVPHIPGLLGSAFLTSDTLWQITELPKRLVILGAGSIGCELGQAFARLGSKVTLVDMANRILAREDQFAAEVIAAALTKDGVEIRTGANVSLASIGRDGKGFLQLDTDNGQSGQVDFDRLLVASGRTPSTHELGLNLAGVELNRLGFLRIDDSLRTTNRRIWAAGDVTGHPQFTHVAGVHASVAASNAVLGLNRKVEVATIPRVTFTQPELAAVGVDTESSDETSGKVLQILNSEVDRAIAECSTAGFTKVAVNSKGRIVGATVVAPRAGEMLAELTLAVRLGLRTRDLASTIHPYPTFSDGPWKVAIADVRDQLNSPLMQRLFEFLRWVARLRLSA